MLTRTGAQRVHGLPEPDITPRRCREPRVPVMRSARAGNGTRGSREMVCGLASCSAGSEIAGGEGEMVTAGETAGIGQERHWLLAWDRGGRRMWPVRLWEFSARVFLSFVPHSARSFLCCIPTQCSRIDRLTTTPPLSSLSRSRIINTAQSVCPRPRPRLCEARTPSVT